MGEVEAAARPSVIVVGAGIAGLFCARELSQRGCDVTLLELTDRLGGRIETGRLKPGPDGDSSEPFAAEFGPMRFELELQPIFKQLLEDYALNAQTFPAPGGNVELPVGSHLDADEMFEGIELPAYPLFQLGVCRLFGLDAHAAAGEKDGDPPRVLRTPESQKRLEALSDDDGSFDELRRTTCVPGTQRLLRDEGLWNALTAVLSANAVRKIMQHGTFFHFLPENLSALEWGIFWLHAFQMKEGLTTLDEGVDILTTKLADDLRSACSRVAIEHGVQVTGLQPLAGGRVEVTASDSSTYAADHVVLAIPRAPLTALAGTFPTRIRDLLDSVNAFPMVKVFAVTTTPEAWGHAKEQQLSQQGAWLVPTREVHYLPFTEMVDGKRVTSRPRENTMVMFYTDRPSTAFWQRYVKKGDDHDRAEINENPDLAEALATQLTVLHVDVARTEFQRRVRLEAFKEAEDTTGAALELAKQLARKHEELFDEQAEKIFERHAQRGFAGLMNALEPLTDVKKMRAWQTDNLHDYAIRDWSRPPYGAASHAWIPGADALEVMDALQAFPLAGSTTENVHIAGEAFSDFQGFIEGALRSARRAIGTIASPS